MREGLLNIGLDEEDEEEEAPISHRCVDCAAEPPKARSAHTLIMEGLALRRRPRPPRRAKILDWYMDGKLNIPDLITHTLSLDQINDGFDLMKRGESIRSVVVY